MSLTTLFNELYADIDTADTTAVEGMVEDMFLTVYGIEQANIPEGFVDWWVGKVQSGEIAADAIVATSLDFVANDQLAAAEQGNAAAIKAASEAALEAANVEGATLEDVRAASKQAAEENVVEETVDGNTFTLTADADDLTGTDGDDLFLAPLTAAGIQTLQSFDRIDGGEGTDTLRATLDAAGANSEEVDIALENVVSNIENFFFRSVTTGADGTYTVDMDGVVGAEQIWSDRSQNNLEVVNVDNAVTIGMIRGEESTYTVEYAEGAVDAAREDGLFTQAVALQNADGTITIDSDDFTEHDTATGEATALVFNVTGDSDVVVDGEIAGELADVSVTGEGNVLLDLRKATNENTRLVTMGADASITLGDGDDGVAVNSGVVSGDRNTLVNIDGGAGSNTLYVDNVANIAALDFRNTSNFDELVLGNGSTTIEVADKTTLDIERDSFTGLTFVNQLTLTNDLRIIGREEFSSLGFDDDVDGAGELELEGFENLDVLIGEGADASFDTIRAEDLVTLSVELEEGAEVSVGSLCADNLESLTVDLGEDGDFEGPTGGSTESLETITISGGEESSFFLAVGPVTPELNTLDLSGFAGEDAGDSSTDFAGQVNMSTTDFSSAVTILVGEGDLHFTLDASSSSVRETFQFVGDDIGTVVIDNFQVSTAQSGDKLDFSGIAGFVSAQDSLNISETDEEGTFIITSDLFEGSITVDTVGTPEPSFFEANAFA